MSSEYPSALGRCYESEGGRGRRRSKRYLTKVQVICLIPSAGTEAPVGGLVTVIPTINIIVERRYPLQRR